MSRYLILFLLNLPFICLGLANTFVAYKIRRVTRRKFIIQTCLWFAILFGLIFAEPAYVYLFSKGLTNTESLSLFDVVQITGIVFILFLANRTRAKTELLERRLQKLHQELSIKLSSDN